MTCAPGPSPTHPRLRVNLVPEGPDGGETFHSFSKVGEQGELGGVIQLLQVPVQGSRAEWSRQRAQGSAQV